MPDPRFAIWSTDTLFIDSPDVGDDGCVCSRCGTRIVRGLAIRAWDTRGAVEYRYHPACLGATPADPDLEEDDDAP